MSHDYAVSVVWTGNTGDANRSHRGYLRDHDVTAVGPAPIAGSSDPTFRGDPSRWNPEQLLVASLAQCHMLWFLHCAGRAGVIVEEYRDDATGSMIVETDGGGQFREVVLHPTVVVADGSMVDQVPELHHEASSLCFIARSVNFPVRHQPSTTARNPA